MINLLWSRFCVSSLSLLQPLQACVWRNQWGWGVINCGAGMMTEGTVEQKEGKRTLLNTNRSAFLWNKRTDVPSSHRFYLPLGVGGVSHLLNMSKQTQLNSISHNFVLLNRLVIFILMFPAATQVLPPEVPVQCSPPGIFVYCILYVCPELLPKLHRKLVSRCEREWVNAGVLNTVRLNGSEQICTLRRPWKSTGLSDRFLTSQRGSNLKVTAACRHQASLSRYRKVRLPLKELLLSGIRSQTSV